MDLWASLILNRPMGTDARAFAWGLITMLERFAVHQRRGHSEPLVSIPFAAGNGELRSFPDVKAEILAALDRVGAWPLDDLPPPTDWWKDLDYQWREDDARTPDRERLPDAIKRIIGPDFLDYQKLAKAKQDNGDWIAYWLPAGWIIGQSCEGGFIALGKPLWYDESKLRSAQFAPGYGGWVVDLGDGTCRLANAPLLGDRELRYGARVDLFYPDGTQENAENPERPFIGYRVYPDGVNPTGMNRHPSPEKWAKYQKLDEEAAAEEASE